MALLEPGRFKAQVTSAGLHRKGPNNLLCLTCYFKAYEGKDGDEYIPIEDDFGIIDDIYLEKKPESGGGLSEDKIKRLVQVFEWQGDLTTLVDCVLNARCKITVKNDTFNGKTRPKVEWLNNINDGDGGGFSVEHDPNLAAQMQKLYGSKLRALLGTGGGKPAPTARPSSAPPSNSAMAQKLNAASGATADSVWEAFEKKMHAEKTPADHVETAWFDFLQESAGTKDQDAVRDWAKVMVALESYSYLPFP